MQHKVVTKAERGQVLLLPPSPLHRGVRHGTKWHCAELQTKRRQMCLLGALRRWDVLNHTAQELLQHAKPNGNIHSAAQPSSSVLAYK